MKSVKGILFAVAFAVGILGAFVTTSGRSGERRAATLSTANVNLKPSSGDCMQADNIEIGNCRLGTGNICNISLNNVTYSVWDQTFSGVTPTCVTQYERP